MTTRQLAYVEDIDRYARLGAWVSADGSIDYLAKLSSLTVPVLQVVSDGDRIECVPDCGARFVARCGGRHDVVRVTQRDDGGPPPDHMGLVTSGGITSVWDRVEYWMRGRKMGR